MSEHRLLHADAIDLLAEGRGARGMFYRSVVFLSAGCGLCAVCGRVLNGSTLSFFVFVIEGPSGAGVCFLPILGAGMDGCGVGRYVVGRVGIGACHVFRSGRAGTM